MVALLGLVLVGREGDLPLCNLRGVDSEPWNKKLELSGRGLVVLLLCSVAGRHLLCFIRLNSL